MIPLETKQYGGKLFRHSDLRVGGVFLEDLLRIRQRKRAFFMYSECWVPVKGAGRSHSMKNPNTSIESVEDFKYLGTALTNQNSIQEEIKSRFKLRNVCYYSVQNLLSSSLLPKNLKIKIYRAIILPVVVYGCEIWSRIGA